MTQAGRCVIAIDAGTTGVRSRAIFADGRSDDASYLEFTQTYPQPGWVEHDAEEIWRLLARRSTRWSTASARRIGRRDRHHQPARDRRRLEPAAPASRTARRSCGRTGAPRIAATSCAMQAICRSSATRTGLVLDPVLLGIEVRVAAAPKRGIPVDDRSGSRHDRLLADLEPHRRQPCMPPTRPTPAARCCSTSARCSGPPSCADCSACRSRRCPRCCPRAAASVTRPRRPAARPASRSPASPATSRRRYSARPASRPAWPRTRTARAASCC